MKKFLLGLLLLAAAGVNAQTFPVNNLQINGTVTPSFSYGVNVRPSINSSVCNGSGNDGPAFLTALAASSTIHISSGSACVISSNLVIPTGTELYIDAGATISVNTGVTLAIRGLVHAPIKQIFLGAGTVAGIGEVWPEWWGATGTGAAHDDAAAIQAAEISMESANAISDGLRVMHFRPVSYGVGSTIQITPQATEKIMWEGAGSSSVQTNFLGLATFTGTAVLQVMGTNIPSDFELKGFSISPQTVGSGAQQGIRFGSSPTSWLIGGKHPPAVSDIYVVDFNQDWFIQDTDLVMFTAVSGWCVSNSNCTPLWIANSASASSFTGDLTFFSGQFVGPPSSTTQYSINIASNTSGAAVAGVRFIGTVIYIDGVQIIAQSGGEIADIWLESGFQLDGATNIALNIGSASAGTVTDIHVDNSYFFGRITNTTPLLNIFSSSGNTNYIFINGNIFYGYNASAPPFAINNASKINFSGNKIRNVVYSGGNVMTVANSSTFQINENTSTDSTYGYFLSISGGQDYYTARSNLCGGIGTLGCVQNTAAGAHSTVDGNW